MATKLFKKEDLQDLVGYCDVDGMEIVEDKIVDTSRWSVHHELIFKSGVVFYSVNYTVGATEMQMESPFDDEDEYVECQEVRAVEKTIMVYEKVID